jgi:tRNA-dihydrouridine synthase A
MQLVYRYSAAAMQQNSGGAPVTVKCRIGVDGVDSYDDLCKFVETVSAEMHPTVMNGRPLFAIHSRKALLNGGAVQLDP